MEHRFKSNLLKIDSILFVITVYLALSVSIAHASMAVNEAANILGVPLGASELEVKKAYQKLARKWHPDFHSNSVESNERLKSINLAYDLLSKLQKEAGSNKANDKMDPADKEFTLKFDLLFVDPSFIPVLREFSIRLEAEQNIDTFLKLAEAELPKYVSLRGPFNQVFAENIVIKVLENRLKSLSSGAIDNFFQLLLSSNQLSPEITKSLLETFFSHTSLDQFPQLSEQVLKKAVDLLDPEIRSSFQEFAAQLLTRSNIRRHWDNLKPFVLKDPNLNYRAMKAYLGTREPLMNEDINKLRAILAGLSTDSTRTSAFQYMYENLHAEVLLDYPDIIRSVTKIKDFSKLGHLISNDALLKSRLNTQAPTGTKLVHMLLNRMLYVDPKALGEAIDNGVSYSFRGGSDETIFLKNRYSELAQKALDMDLSHRYKLVTEHFGPDALKLTPILGSNTRQCRSFYRTIGVP
ncbi:MAG: hypothetical protein B7Y39_16695 [Bdellovibrio sp. 28-41-41]|nr:MAG: hypothetical protein B7Y39_16695 [Bdellovibrio sp. 28-41-41]